MIPSSTVQPSVVFLGEELRRRGQTSAVLATLKWRTPRIGSAVTTFITACMHRYLSAGMPLLKRPEDDRIACQVGYACLYPLTPITSNNTYHQHPEHACVAAYQLIHMCYIQ